MQVIKRSNKKEAVSFDKVTARINKLCYGLNSKFIDPIEISRQITLIDQELYQSLENREFLNMEWNSKS